MRCAEHEALREPPEACSDGFVRNVDAPRAKGVMQHVAYVIEAAVHDVPRQDCWGGSWDVGRFFVVGVLGVVGVERTNEEIGVQLRLGKELSRSKGVIPHRPLHPLPGVEDEQINVDEHANQAHIREGCVTVERRHELHAGPSERNARVREAAVHTGEGEGLAGRGCVRHWPGHA